MREYFNLGIRLMLIALIAGLLLAGTNAITADEIARQKMLKAEKSRQEVLPGAGIFELVFEDENGEIRSVYQGNGGYVFELHAQGYGSGGMTVTVGILDGRVSGVRVDASGETPGLGAKAGDAAYYTRYEGLSGQEVSDVAGISGATVTSNAVKDAVSSAITYFDEHFGG